MARMTAAQRRIMWEVALSGERVSEHSLGPRMLRYSGRFNVTATHVPLRRLIEDGLVERFEDAGQTLLRFGAKVTDARRRAFEDAAIETATRRRSELMREARSAVIHLRSRIEECAVALSGARVKQPGYAAMGEMDRLLGRLRDATERLDHLDSWVGLDQVAPRLRPRMRELYRPMKL